MAYLFSCGSEDDKRFNGEKRTKLANSSDSFRRKRQTAICQQCRAQFPSNNKLHNHIREDCWATKSERKCPGVWGPALTEYVRRAFDPINNVPDWTNANIQEELEVMIYIYDFLDAGSSFWRTMELPQHIDPRQLPYQRIRRHRSKPQSVESRASASKIYPREFCASSSTPKSLFAHKDREFSSLIETLGNCWFIRTALVETMARRIVKLDVHLSHTVAMEYLDPGIHRTGLTICTAPSSFAWKMLVLLAFVRFRQVTGQNFALFWQRSSDFGPATLTWTSGSLKNTPSWSLQRIQLMS